MIDNLMNYEGPAPDILYMGNRGVIPKVSVYDDREQFIFVFAKGNSQHKKKPDASGLLLTVQAENTIPNEYGSIWISNRSNGIMNELYTADDQDKLYNPISAVYSLYDGFTYVCNELHASTAGATKKYSINKYSLTEFGAAYVSSWDMPDGTDCYGLSEYIAKDNYILISNTKLNSTNKGDSIAIYGLYMPSESSKLHALIKYSDISTIFTANAPESGIGAIDVADETLYSVYNSDDATKPRIIITHLNPNDLTKTTASNTGIILKTIDVPSQPAVPELKAQAAGADSTREKIVDLHVMPEDRGVIFYTKIIEKEDTAASNSQAKENTLNADALSLEVATKTYTASACYLIKALKEDTQANNNSSLLLNANEFTTKLNYKEYNLMHVNSELPGALSCYGSSLSKTFRFGYNLMFYDDFSFLMLNKWFADQNPR